MSITSAPYGKLPDGRAVTEYTLSNASGMTARVITLGGIITALEVPDRDGKRADIVLGKADLEAYAAGHPCFGTITGRVVGRITEGKFSLDGVDYALEQNDGGSPNHLHGGSDGFDKQLWEGSTFTDGDVEILRLHYLDPDGHNGYPGNLDCTVEYRLTDVSELVIDYTFMTDKATPLNVTNHSYFNLKGEGNGDILDHQVQILADQFAVTSDDMTLLGHLESVNGQPNDFRHPAVLSERIAGLHQNHGDNYFFPDGRTAEPRLVAHVVEPTSGRVMECLTTEPGLQFYTSSMMQEGESGKRPEAPYSKHSGLCLETQGCPEAVNKPALGDIILRPGDVFRSRTVYRFGVLA